MINTIPDAIWMLVASMTASLTAMAARSLGLNGTGFIFLMFSISFCVIGMWQQVFSN